MNNKSILAIFCVAVLFLAYLTLLAMQAGTETVLKEQDQWRAEQFYR
jgi:hypothetical protein